MGTGDKNPPGDLPGRESSDRKLLRILNDTMKSRLPSGVELMLDFEAGKVIELHEMIRQSFNPSACARAEELTSYLWSVGRTVVLEPGGGITISGGGSAEKYVIGRKFYSEAEDEYRMLHGFVAGLLS